MEKKIARIAIQANLVLLALQILIIFSTWRFLPPEIPLFYSHPWGKEQLAEHSRIVLLPSLCLVIFLVNLILARLAAKEELFLKQILKIASLTFSFLISVSLVQIIRLII